MSPTYLVLLGALVDIEQETTGVVRETNVLGKAQVLDLLHALPGLTHANLDNIDVFGLEVRLVRSAPPHGRV